MIEPRLASCRCSCAKDFAIYLITAKMTPLHSELVHLVVFAAPCNTCESIGFYFSRT